MNDARVFVVQKQHRWDDQRQEFVPKFDLSPAEEYGTLEFLLSPTAAPFRPEALITDLRDKLQDIRTYDYLLLIGNPVLIGLATAVAADYLGGQVQLLQWHGKAKKYLPIQVHDVFGHER